MKNACFYLKNVKVNDILDIDELLIATSLTTCILGPSGSGKTTLLRLLNKLISLDHGTIHYLNQALDSLDSIALRKEVIMLSQTPIMLEKTIKDNLLVGLRYSKKAMPSQEILLEMLNKLQLHKRLDDDAHQCSLGEKQRIALGRVLLMTPKVYLMDEPSSSLDSKSEQLIIKLIVEHTKKNNQTLIMVTHNQQVADDYADNVVHIEKGRIR